MRKIIGISILLVTVTLMSFAGGLGFNPRGELGEGVGEIAGLEKEYQFFSMLNHIGFTQRQLEQIIVAAEKAKGSILSVESEVKNYLENAVEWVKAGDTEKAKEKHEEAMQTAKDVLEIRETYMDTLKGIITVEQQEKFMGYFSATIKNAREQRNVQGTPQIRVQPNARGMLNQNLHVNFFNMLLIDDNLELMKEYLESGAVQKRAE